MHSGGQSLPYYSPIRRALVDLYGLDPSEELNDDNAKSISARMDAKRHEGTWYGEVYHHVPPQLEMEKAFVR